MHTQIWSFHRIRGPQYRPQYTIVLINVTPNKVPLIWHRCRLRVDVGLKRRGFGDQNAIKRRYACASEPLRPKVLQTATRVIGYSVLKRAMQYQHRLMLPSLRDAAFSCTAQICAEACQFARARDTDVPPSPLYLCRPIYPHP